MTVFNPPNSEGSLVELPSRLSNFIGGEFVAPKKGRYFDNVSPVTGKVYCEAPRSGAEDIERALDAAHGAREAWAKTPPAERAAVLLKIADRMEENLQRLAVAESYDNGKAIREALAADIPLAIDHFRYFAAAIRTQEGGISRIDDTTVAYNHKEPMGVVAQIIPWNFPILMMSWKLAPALAAGNCVVMKPAEQTPVTAFLLMQIISDLLPAGVVNMVHGYGLEAGKPLAQSPRVAKVAFTGETTTGRLIMQYASHNLNPVTLELGGKSPNVFTGDVCDSNDAFRTKALEGFAMFALTQGQACTCPSRALVAAEIWDEFVPAAVERTRAIKVGNPLDVSTMMGPIASAEQLAKIERYVDIGKNEGAEFLTGGGRVDLGGDLRDGFFFEPTVFVGNNKMQTFQEEIFGPMVGVAKFDTVEQAIEIANDTPYGLAGAVWSRNGNVATRVASAIEAGRVWVNAYHLYPVHAAFGGYKQSGIGRETHKMMLEHYQQTKSIVVSTSENELGFF